jgi:vacuolar iron transporter family protein
MKSKYISEVIYGAIDGTVTTFAVVAGCEGADFGHKIIVILGLSNVFADGFSMAVSAYFAKQTEEQFKTAHMPKSCIKSAIVTFCSFVAVGMVPLYIYIISVFANVEYQYDFFISCVSTAIVFFLVGFIKGVVNKEIPVRESLKTLFFGGAASALAYFLGDFLRGIIINGNV